MIVTDSRYWNLEQPGGISWRGSLQRGKVPFHVCRVAGHSRHEMGLSMCFQNMPAGTLELQD